MELSTIGALIRHRRKECHLSQAALAEKMGIGDKSTISDWENGKFPKLENIVSLANALDCDPEYLLGCVEHPSVTTSWIAEQIPLSSKTIDSLRGLKEECDNRKEDNALTDDSLMTLFLADCLNQFVVIDQYAGGSNETLLDLAFGYVKAIKTLAEYDGVKMATKSFIEGYEEEADPLADDWRMNPPDRYRMAKWEKETCFKKIGELLAENICNTLEAYTRNCK